MRLLYLLPAALCLTSPAFARDPVPTQRNKADDVARALSNPAVQGGIADIVSQMAAAMLDTRVGPLAHYTDPRDDLRPDDTLRDLATRDDPAFERHLHERTRGAVAATGAAARDVAALSSELGATVDRLRRVLDAASAAVPRDGDRDGY